MSVTVSQFSAMARAEFMRGKLAADNRPVPADATQFTTVLPSTAKVETHTYMTNLPRLQRFKGYNPSVRLQDKTYTVTNEPYRIGPVTVRKHDLDDEQIGGYIQSIQGMVPRAQKDIQHYMLKFLADGTTNACFDGTNFFANSHTFGSGDNLDTFDSTSNDGVNHVIIAMVTENPIKPILFQDREPLSELKTDADTPQADKLQEFEYWADTRYGLGYGFWWDAYRVAITDTPSVSEVYTIVEQIINGLRSFTLPKGRDSDDLLYTHEGWDPNPGNFVLACNLKLGAVLKRAMAISQYVTSTGNVDNVYKDVARIVPTSALGA